MLLGPVVAAPSSVASGGITTSYVCSLDLRPGRGRDVLDEVVFRHLELPVLSFHAHHVGFRRNTLDLRATS
jgi:hypothetical protein